jgi:hypothetical protein
MFKCKTVSQYSLRLYSSKTTEASSVCLVKAWLVTLLPDIWDVGLPLAKAITCATPKEYT